MNKEFKKILLIPFFILISCIFLVFILNTLYVWSENRNFKKLRIKSELDCVNMPIHCTIDNDQFDDFNLLINNKNLLETKDNW
jgi:hypothetical protein